MIWTKTDSADDAMTRNSGRNEMVTPSFTGGLAGDPRGGRTRLLTFWELIRTLLAYRAWLSTGVSRMRRLGDDLRAIKANCGPQIEALTERALSVHGPGHPETGGLAPS